MFEVRVEADFSAAHFLKDYRGKCENLHGHNYRVLAHVTGEALGEGGMLFDFSKLKAALQAACAKLDHTNLNDIAFFEGNPSAERIALFIADRILHELPQLHRGSGGQAWLCAVDVFESATSRARYRL